MATIGQALTAPEAGWQRVDDSNTNITYVNGTAGSCSSCYNGGFHQGINMAVHFNVAGTTRLRLIGWIGVASQYTPHGIIKVDGAQVGTFTQAGGDAYQILNADISGLTTNEHNIEISCSDGMYLGFDAIDIDASGTLKPYNPSPAVSAPTNLAATAGDSKVTLNWAAVTGATGYNVKRSTTAGGPYTTIAANVTSTNYIDTSVTNGTTYYYVVTALSDTAESGNSNEASATPVVSAPTNLAATAGNSQVSLSWSAVSTATGYNVKRSTTAGGPYTVIASNVSVNSYVDSNVTNGTTYYYVVTALGGTSESSNSNEASATPQGHGLLKITMNDSSEREYQLTDSEIAQFIEWCNRTVGTGNAYYVFNKDYNVGDFKSRKEYLMFEKIISFEVMELTK